MLTQILVSSLLVLIASSASLQEADSAQCSLCKSAVSELKVIWEDKDSKDFRALVKTYICAPCPSKDCEKWITGKLAVLGTFIESLDPTEACTLITTCPSDPSVDMFHAVAKVGVTPLCEACHDLLGELKKTAFDPETKNMADQLAPVLCELIEIPFCKSLFAKFFEENLIKTQNLDVDGTCVSLKACDVVGDTQTVKNLGDVCSECTQLAQNFLKLLENEEVDSLINEAIGDLCTILSISDCVKTLPDYIFRVIVLLNWVGGQTLCEVLGLCESVEYNFTDQWFSKLLDLNYTSKVLNF